MGQGNETSNRGISQESGAQVSSTSGNITYEGTGGNGTGSNHGIYLDGTNTSVSSTQGGNITVTGTGQGNGTQNFGIYQSNAQVTTTGNGTVIYEGIGGNGTNNNFGIYLLNGSARITSEDGAIALTGEGRGNGANNYGISQQSGAQVSSTSGNITYTGTGANGAAILTLSSSNRIGNGTSGNISLISTNNVITLNDLTVNTTGNLHINSPANVSQNASSSLQATGLELLGAGNFTLSSATNAITTLAGNTTGAISYRDSGGFAIGTVGTTNGLASQGAITLNAGGAVTQTQALSATSLDLLGAGNFTLTHTSNAINTLTGNTTGAISYTNSVALTIGNLTTGNSSLTLMTPGSLTFNGIISTGTEDITATGGMIGQTGGTLTSTGIASFESTQANVGTVSANNTTNTNLGNSTIGGNFTLTSTGAITQSGFLKVAGTTNLNGATVTLSNPDNLLLDLTATTSAGDLIRSQVGPITLAGQTITGNLSMTSIDGTTTTGYTNSHNGNAITLGGNNNLGGEIRFNTNMAGLSQGIVGGGTASISQTGILEVSGTSNFTAMGGTIDLSTHANQLTGAVSLDTGVTGGNISLQNNQATQLAGVTTGDNLTITTGGNLTQSGAISAGGTTTLNVGANDITLDNVNNDFNVLGLTAANAAIQDTNELELAASTLTGNLSVTSGGDLTQSTATAVSVTGATTFNTGTHNITLDDAGNDFNTLGITAANATIVDQNALELTTSAIANTLSITTQGDLTQSGSLTTQNLAILGSGNTLLNHSDNQIQTLAADTTGNLTVLTATNLTIDTVNPNGIENADTVLLQAGGDITLNQGINADNNVTLIATENFINNAGANALQSTSGRWLVYSTSPQGNVNGWSVLGGGQQFSTTYPTPPGFAGNGFVYRVAAPLLPPVTSNSPVILSTAIAPTVNVPAVPSLPPLSTPPTSSVSPSPIIFTSTDLPLPSNLSTILQGQEEDEMPLEQSLCQLLEKREEAVLEIDGVPIESALAEECR